MECDLNCRYHGLCNFVFEKNGYKIYECKSNRLQFCELSDDEETYLKKVYSDAYFTEGKDGYTNYLEEKDILVRHGRWYAHKLEKYISSGKMLDIGAAAGFIMQGFKDSGWVCTGLEPNQNMTQYANSNLDLNVIQGDIEHYSSKETFDLVSMIQVVGHFYDLNQALQNIYNHIKPNGYLLVESWDRGSIIAKILGKKWHEYSPPSVINYYTKNSLNTILKKHGFRLLKYGRPKKQISLKHALSLISKEYSFFNIIKKTTDIVLKKRNLFLNYPPVDLFYAIYQKPSRINNNIVSV
jgi:SAM-dependent methyltransferase